MGWSTAKREQWMDEIEALEIWMALFSADPEGSPDPALLEIESGVYTRQESLWTRTDATHLTLASGLVWRNLPPGAIVAAVGGFDDAFTGDYLFSGLVLPDPVSYPAGGTYVLPAGEYVLSID